MTPGLCLTLVATSITFFMVGIFVAAIVKVGVANYLLERALKTSTLWQRRARRAEEGLRRLREAADGQGRAA